MKLMPNKKMKFECKGFSQDPDTGPVKFEVCLCMGGYQQLSDASQLYTFCTSFVHKM